MAIGCGLARPQTQPALAWRHGAGAGIPMRKSFCAIAVSTRSASPAGAAAAGSGLCGVACAGAYKWARGPEAGSKSARLHVEVEATGTSRSLAWQSPAAAAWQWPDYINNHDDNHWLKLNCA